jgi:hypothetical protein
MRLFLLFIVVFVSTSVLAQFKESKTKLAPELKEISGLALVNDTTLIGMNDSGNEPLVYFMTIQGSIFHTCKVINAKNHDWEDLTIDSLGILYIGDCGNNENKRKDLVILKLDTKKALANDSISVEKIHFTYEDQTAFPPKEDQLEFDCEAIYWRNDSIFMVTKTYSKPWKGNASIYGVSTVSGKQVAKKTNTLFIGNGGWMKDAVTAADCKKDNLYLLTYNRMLIFDLSTPEPTKLGEYVFDFYTQKEAILSLSPNQFMVAAEKHKALGGPFLYTIVKK